MAVKRDLWRRSWLAACCGVVVATLLACGGDDGDSTLPACDELAGSPVVEVGGCVTASGRGLQSFQYECADGKVDGVTIIPDAGLVGVRDEEWAESAVHGAYNRKPFGYLGPNRCEVLRSSTSDWPARVTCDLSGTPLDMLTTQGCSREGEPFPGVGRVCSYFDFDITATWEQWWIDAPPEDYGRGPFVYETDSAGIWQITPAAHRDDRCRTHPDEWEPDWRYEG